MTAIQVWSPKSIASAITVAASTLALLHYYSSKFSYDKKVLNLLPSPKGYYPYFGHLLSFDKLPGCKLKEWHDQLGPVIRVQMGVQPWIVVSDPDILHHLLSVNGAVASNRPYQEFTIRDYSHGGRGIVFQDSNSRWRRLRAVAATLSFSSKAVSNSISEIQGDAMQLVNSLVAACQNQHAVNPLQLLQRASVSHALRTCFGIEVDTTEESLLQRIYKFTHETLVLAGTHNDFGGFLPILSSLDKLPGRNTKQKEYMQKKDILLRELLQHALEKSDKDNMFKNLYHSHKELGLTDVDLLVAAGDIIVGATETVSVVIKWIFAILLHHPDLYKRLCDEVDTFIHGHDGRLPFFSERDSLPLLCSVQKESMRYRGTNYTTLPHVLQEDIHYKGYVFPKGVLILPSSYTMHRDPARYPDPEKFIPERFMDDSKTMAAATAGPIEERDHYMFGWGRRACPGIHLAEVQLFTFLTSVLAHCKLEPPIDGSLPDLDDIRDAGVVMSPPPFEAQFVCRQDCLLC